jgi:hypothetical protein
LKLPKLVRKEIATMRSVKGQEYTEGLFFAVEPAEYQTEITLTVKVQTKKGAFAPIVYCSEDGNEHEVYRRIAESLQTRVENAITCSDGFPDTRWENVEVTISEPKNVQKLETGR